MEKCIKLMKWTWFALKHAVYASHEIHILLDPIFDFATEKSHSSTKMEQFGETCCLSTIAVSPKQNSNDRQKR